MPVALVSKVHLGSILIRGLYLNDVLYVGNVSRDLVITQVLNGELDISEM